MPKRVPIAVAVVDEETLVRSILAAFIAQLGPYKVVLTTGHGAAFIGAAAECAAPRIAAVAISAEEGPEADWQASMQWMKAHWPDTRILAITCERSRAVLQRAVTMGACGFLCRATSMTDELAEALRQLDSTGHYHTADVLAILAQDEPAPVLDPRFAGLSHTLLKVLDQVCTADDPTWPMVGERLHRSGSTMVSHSAALRKHLGLRNKLALVVEGRKAGFGKGAW
ncbi:MAG: response regulator transcription factor [Flavobacteriales bacterium]|nr:response regulator transcription factor [Flavobacteriales bacterium]